MNAATETNVVVRELTIDAARETVWEFLVDPEKATRWMGMSATLDPRPGGVYRVEIIPGNTAVGEFIEVDPPNFTPAKGTTKKSARAGVGSAKSSRPSNRPARRVDGTFMRST